LRESAPQPPMINLKQLLLAALCTTIFTPNYAQGGRTRLTNGFAIGGGLTQFDILTDNFNTIKGEGWSISASNTGDLPYKWYNISYGMQLSDNVLNVEGLQFDNGNLRRTQVEYNVLEAQLVLLFHFKVLPNILTLDFGPVAQFNSKLEMQSFDEENLFVTTTDSKTILAKDLEDISQINFNAAVGATLGFKFIQFRAQYIHGFTNILNKLNDQDFNTGTGKSKFKGTQSMALLSALIAF